MGQLHDRDAWAERFPEGEKADVVSALAGWVDEEEFDLYHRGWFDTGRSNAPVARVLRDFKRDAEQLVLKFSDVPQRVADLRRGWTASAGFREAHLAQIEGETIRLGGNWRAVFMRIASGDLDRVDALTEQLDRPNFPILCSTIIRSVIGDWNQNRAPVRLMTAGALLDRIIDRRRYDVEAWAQSASVALDGSSGPVDEEWPDYLPSPFKLLAGDGAGRTIGDVIVGKAHGDLSGRNILVPSRPTVEPVSYILIDYDRFDDQAPLARDPMHLLVALALDHLDSLGPSLWPGLAQVLVDPHSGDVPAHLGHFQRVSKSIHSTSAALAVEKGSGDSWTQHCLLSLVGVGLLHLGRTLHTRDPDAAKRWCFRMAAVATDAYLREVGGSTGKAASRPQFIAASAGAGAKPSEQDRSAKPVPADSIENDAEHTVAETQKLKEDLLATKSLLSDTQARLEKAEEAARAMRVELDAASRSQSALRRLVAAAILPSIGLVLSLIAWWFVSTQVNEPALLPSPAATAGSLVDNPEYLFRGAMSTLSTALVGFGLAAAAGLIVAFLFSWLPVAERIFSPVFVAINAVPKVALAPLLVLWLGSGMNARVALVGLFCFFPIVVATMAGLASSPPELLELARSLGASKPKTMTKIRIRWAMPHVFVGLKIASVLAVLGAILAELMSPLSGLGAIIVISGASAATPMAFAAVALLATISTLVFYAIVALERLLIPWSRRIEL